MEGLAGDLDPGGHAVAGVAVDDLDPGGHAVVGMADLDLGLAV